MSGVPPPDMPTPELGFVLKHYWQLLTGLCAGMVAFVTLKVKVGGMEKRLTDLEEAHKEMAAKQSIAEVLMARIDAKLDGLSANVEYLRARADRSKDG